MEAYASYYAVRIDELTKKSLHYKEQCTKSAQLQQDMSALQQTIHNGSTTSAPQLAITVMEHVLRAGLQITSYTQDAPQKSTWAEYTAMHFGMEGTLQQLRSFLTTIAHESLIIQCTDLELSQLSASLFACSCTLKLYIYTSKIS